MKIATSPIEPVAVMTMTWRIVEPVTNLAVSAPLRTVTAEGRSEASWSPAWRQLSAGSATFSAWPSLSMPLGFAASA